MEAINTVLKTAEIILGDPQIGFYLFIGAPGITADAKREEFIRYGRENYYSYFEKVRLDTDVYLTWQAALDGKDGAVFIAGTGSIAMYFSQKRIAESKESYSFPFPPGDRVDGGGFPQSDSWGLARIGLSVIQELFKYIDGRKVAEPVLKQAFDNLYQYFFQSDRAIMLNKVNAGPGSEFVRADPESYKRVAEFFLQQTSGKEEPFTESLLKRAAKEFTLAYRAIMKGRESSPCYVWGTGLNHFIKYLPSDIVSNLGTTLKVAPAEAAIKVLRQAAGPMPVTKSASTLTDITEKTSAMSP